MSFEITTAFVQQYRTNVQHLLQQRGSRLRTAVSSATYTGKAAKAVEQVGAVAAQKRASRHADTPLILTPHDARWVYPVDYEWADLVDNVDKLRMLVDPTSAYALNAAYALGRAIDEEIINAFFATSKTGENGTTDTAFDTANQQVAAGSTGLTVAKLRSAKRVLMENDVDIDNDPLFIAITAQQHDNMLGETQAVSLDFNTRPTLVDGKITSFMGFNFVHSEKLLKTGSDRRCPAWAMSGMHLGVWEDVTTRVTERADKSHAVQVFARGTFGATRLEEGKVVEVLCTEV